MREMEGELNDVRDDLDTERKDRQRAEKLRKDLSEELEALKTELEETTETGAVQQQVSVSAASPPDLSAIQIFCTPLVMSMSVHASRNTTAFSVMFTIAIHFHRFCQLNP